MPYFALAWPDWGTTCISVPNNHLAPGGPYHSCPLLSSRKPSLITATHTDLYPGHPSLVTFTSAGSSGRRSYISWPGSWQAWLRLPGAGGHKLGFKLQLCHPEAA